MLDRDYKSEEQNTEVPEKNIKIMSDEIERLKSNQRKIILGFAGFMIAVACIAVITLISNGTPIVYIVSGGVGVIFGLKILNNVIGIFVPVIAVMFGMVLGVKGILGLIVCCGIAYVVSGVDEKIIGKIETLTKSIDEQKRTMKI